MSKQAIPNPDPESVLRGIATIEDLKNAPCRMASHWYSSRVSIQEIKAEIAALTLDQQDQLAAFLVHLRHQRDSAIPAAARTKIDDQNPANWLSVEELRERWKD